MESVICLLNIGGAYAEFHDLQPDICDVNVVTKSYFFLYTTSVVSTNHSQTNDFLSLFYVFEYLEPCWWTVKEELGVVILLEVVSSC